MNRRIRQRLTSGAVLCVLGLVLWGYVVSPLLSTIQQSILGEGGPFRDYLRFFDFGKNAQGEALLGSITLSLMSVITAGVVGLCLAVLLNRWDFPFKKVCRVLVLMPIALPPLIGAEAFVWLYGIGGIIPQLLGSLLRRSAAAFALRGMSGVLLVHTLTMYPYFYLSVAASLAQADDSLEEAAHSLGASRFRVWRRVLLPMLTPALVAGALLTFMSSMASYTAPALFDVDNVMTVQIVNAKMNYNDLSFASVISVMLAFASILFLVVMRGYEQRCTYRTQSKGGARKQRRIISPFARAIVLAVALISSLYLVLPIAMIFLFAFAVNGSFGTSLLPSKYTFENFITLFSNPHSWEPIKNSLQMSALAVLGTILLGVACAYVISRMRVRGKGLIDIAIMLPWALPGTVVAISLITAFARGSVFSLGRVLVGTYAMVPLAYFVRFSPLVFRSTTASLAQLDPALEDAARSLGGSWLYAFRRVVLPLIYRGVAAGALLAFVSGVGEYVATILLYSPYYQTLSIAIKQELYYVNFGTAASFGVVQVLLVMIAIIATIRVEDRKRALAIS